jgi:hypothetical protein
MDALLAVVVEKNDFTALADPEAKAKYDAVALEVWKADDPNGVEVVRLRAYHSWADSSSCPEWTVRQTYKLKGGYR